MNFSNDELQNAQEDICARKNMIVVMTATATTIVTVVGIGIAIDLPLGLTFGGLAVIACKLAAKPKLTEAQEQALTDQLPSLDSDLVKTQAARNRVRKNYLFRIPVAAIFG